MEVKVDGVIYQNQSYGGVSRIYNEVLPRMCDIDPALQVTIFTSGSCQQNIPTHQGIRHQSLLPIDDLLRPRRIWRPVQQQARRLVQQLAMTSSSGAIWHSTYFTEPKKWNGPVVVTVYDMIHERFPELFASAADADFRNHKRRSVLSADSVICISETTLNDVQSYYGINRVKLQAIPLAYNRDFQHLDSDDYPQKLTIQEPFLLYVGRRSSYKNFKTLLRAYCVWERRNEIDLLVVGPAWSGQERKWLADRGCTKKVHLLSSVDDQLLVYLYNHAQAFVYPSLFEGFGIPLLEAVACGCPVVASRIPTTVEVAGEHPFYFEPTDVDSLLAALEAALSEGRQPARIESGIEIARKYSWDKCARQTLRLYRSLSTV